MFVMYKCLISFTYLTNYTHSQIKRYQPGIIAHTSNHSTGEAEAGISASVSASTSTSEASLVSRQSFWIARARRRGMEGCISNSIKFDKWMARNGETLKSTSNRT